MIGTLHRVGALCVVTFAHLLFLFFVPMLGCGFSPAPSDEVDDNMDDPNLYTCGCRCGTAVTQTFALSAAADDAEEAAGDPLDLDGSADLDLVVRTVGLRFVGIDVPPGAVITSARMQFSADQEFAGSNAGLTNLQIFGEAADDARRSAVTSPISTRASRRWNLYRGMYLLGPSSTATLLNSAPI